jgi:hypothetical protein
VVGPDGAVDVGTTGARLYLGRLDPGRISLPAAPLQHLFVVDGEVALGDRELVADDAARVTEEGGRALDVATRSTIALWSFETVRPAPSRAPRNG